MNLKVLLLASELFPYAKTGGLGEAISILSKELRRQNIDARVIFPKYKTLSKYDNLSTVCKFPIGIKWRHHQAHVLQINDNTELFAYTIANDHFFLRDNFYGYEDDFERFNFFTLAALELLKHIDFKPHIIHFNDWQVGLGSFYLKEKYSAYDEHFYQNISSVFSIHNIQHQGNFDKGILSPLDIPEYYYTPELIELFGKVSFMKSGIVYSDIITTVSETYAKEIQTPAYSYGLDGVISSRKKDLFGIINGIYYNDTNGSIIKDKKYLQERVALPIKNVPVIALITRLVEQKGIDIIALALEEILSHELQLIVLGTGEYRYENLFLDYGRRYKNLSSHIYFSTELSLDIYKHSDMFLMPSLFEPCGLSQMISMKYGTIPIVRKTGGLEDTVQHFNAKNKTGNGFVFEDYDANGLMWALKEALNLYNNQSLWKIVCENALKSKFTAEDSAKKYIEIYKKIANKKISVV